LMKTISDLISVILSEPINVGFGPTGCSRNPLNPT
jgi:hypothetical protein